MRRSTLVAPTVALALGLAIGRATAPEHSEALADVASFRAALEDPDWLTRTHRLAGFLQTLSPESLPAALEVLEPQLPWLVTDELRLFMMAWTRFDEVGAFDWATGLEPPFHRNAAGAAIYALGFRNPAAGLNLLSTVEDAELREFMQGRMVAGWAHGPHRDGLDDYLVTLDPGARRFAYVGMLAWELSKQGPEAVRRWADGIPEEHTRYKAAAFLKAATTLAAIDPPGTARWLASHLEHDYSDGAMRVVARSWAAADPHAALPWLAALPASDRRDSQLRHAFRVWHDAAPAEAEAWLKQALPAPALDAALRVMVERKRRREPEVARQWASLASDALREELLARVASASEASGGDPGSASAAVPTGPD